MQPIITSEVVVAYAQCPRKAYLLLFSPEQGTPHEYIRVLERYRRAHQAQYLDSLTRTHMDVHPYTLEHLRHASAVLINAWLQVDGLAAACDVLTRVAGPPMAAPPGMHPRYVWARIVSAQSRSWPCSSSGMCWDVSNTCHPRLDTSLRWMEPLVPSNWIRVPHISCHS